MTKESLEEKLDDVREEINKDRSYLVWLWRGILFGVGSTVGVALIFYIFIVIAEQLAGVPILGNALQSLEPLIEQTVETRVPNAQKFLPNSPLEVVDPTSRYRLEVPKTWTVKTLEGNDGVQVSRVEIETPDFRSKIDETTNTVYYENGAKLNIEVLERFEEPNHRTILEEKEIRISGQSAQYIVYKKGNTGAGRLIDVRIQKDDELYLLTFVYNPETFLNSDAIFDDILASFTITE